jgi:CBS domain containing-hemolysin-like protein
VGLNGYFVAVEFASVGARLSRLEAEADNDLGASDQALPLVDEALVLAPRMVEAMHERGICM